MRFSLKPGTPPEEVPYDDASFGPLRLQNMPMAILACIPRLFAIGTKIEAAVIQKAITPTSAATQPNA